MPEQLGRQAFLRGEVGRHEGDPGSAAPAEEGKGEADTGPRVPAMPASPQALICASRPARGGDNITAYAGYLSIVAILLLQFPPTYGHGEQFNNC